jgi:hypothetical protein
MGRPLSRSGHANCITTATAATIRTTTTTTRTTTTDERDAASSIKTVEGCRKIASRKGERGMLWWLLWLLTVTMDWFWSMMLFCQDYWHERRRRRRQQHQPQRRRTRSSSRSSSVVNLLLSSVVLLLVLQVLQFYRMLQDGSSSSSSSSSRAATTTTTTTTFLYHHDVVPWKSPTIKRSSPSLSLWNRFYQEEVDKEQQQQQPPEDSTTNSSLATKQKNKKKKRRNTPNNKMAMMGLMMTTTSTAMGQEHQLQPQKRHQPPDTEQVKVAKEMLSPEAIRQVSPQTSRQQCSSPETATTPWPLNGSTTPMLLLTSSNRTCGLLNNHHHLHHYHSSASSSAATAALENHHNTMTFVQYFRTVLIRQQIRPLLFHQQQQQEELVLLPTCPDLVVFGVAFGKRYIKEMQVSPIQVGGRVNSTAILEKNGPCFFMFTLEESMQHLFPSNNNTSSGSNITNNNSNDQKETLPGTSSFPSPILLGHNWLIPIPQRILPYTNNRRNAKLLKYMGHYAFLLDNNNDDNDYDGEEDTPIPSPKRIIWQDAKFFRPFSLFDQSIPTDYSTLWIQPDQHHQSTIIKEGREQGGGDDHHDNGVDHDDPPPICLTTVRLPIHPSSFSQLHRFVSMGQTSRFFNHRNRGSGGDGQSYSLYREHCQTVISALRARPNVTDSPQSLLHQCQAYIRHVQEQQQNTIHQHHHHHHPLDYGLIDSAFMVWDESTEICRNFNQQLRCTLLDQLHCHSDRDQVLFPFVLYKLLILELEQQHSSSSSSKTAASIQDETGSTRLQAMYTSTNDNDDHDSYVHRHRRHIPVDQYWNGRFHDLDFVAQLKGNNRQASSSSTPTTVILSRTIRSACHWYHTFPVGSNNCLHYRWLPPPQEEHRNNNINNYYLTTELTTTKVIAGDNTTNNNNTTTNNIKFGDLIHLLRTSNHHHNESTTVQLNKSMGQDGSNKCSIFGDDAALVAAPTGAYLVKELIQPLLLRCPDLVVFGFALEKELLGWIHPNTTFFTALARNHLKKHGKCFFMLVLEDDLRQWQKLKELSGEDEEKADTTTTADTTNTTVVFNGYQWLIPIPRSMLPVQDLQQSMYFFKYHAAGLLFPGTKTIIWQDPTIFFRPGSLGLLPVTYHDFLGPKADREPCLTAFAIPTSKSTTGKIRVDPPEEVFVEYSKVQIANLLLMLSDDSGRRRDEITREASSLLDQCDEYLQHVYGKELGVEFLSHGLVDTDFLIWNESTERCRRFNHEVRSKIWTEMQCRHHQHSVVARDTVIFPFVLYRMNVTTEYGRNHRIPINDKYLRRIHDVQFYDEVELTMVGRGGVQGQPSTKQDKQQQLKQQQPQPAPLQEVRPVSVKKAKFDLVRVVRSSCHWRNSPMGTQSCPTFHREGKNTDPALSTKKLKQLKQIKQNLGERPKW